MLLFLMLIVGATPTVRANIATDYPQVRALFPGADHFGESEGSPPASAVHANNELIGFAFLTMDMVRIPAYSGSPINILVGIDIRGRITGARIVHHTEPILAAGISEAELTKFVDQYQNKPASGRIVVGATRDGYTAVDAISGATISTMVINASVTRAARMVAESRGIPLTEAVTPSVPMPVTVPTHDKTAAAAGPAPAARPVEATLPQSAAAAASIEPAAVPALTATIAMDESPIWPTLWHLDKVKIVLLLLGLVLLTCILLFQDYLARRPTLLRRVRTGFLAYTLFFIGWYAMGQLSIVNVLTFVQAISHQFSWETFLIDPILFILWSFVAVTLLLWGRGVYCGWLCPFGALQEFVFQFARKLRLPFFEIPYVVHERMLALKFVILLVLFGLSLQSMELAIRVAEIEPFKTAFTLRFQREWGYVAFALGVLLLAALNRKFYCKYICPLGASLIIPGRFRSFEWLRRRKECGKPCQACAMACEVQAIRPTGEIVLNECHHCLDCQVAYYDEYKCPPLVVKRRRRERGSLTREFAWDMEGAGDATSHLNGIPITVMSILAEDDEDAESPCLSCRANR